MKEQEVDDERKGVKRKDQYGRKERLYHPNRIHLPGETRR